MIDLFSLERLERLGRSKGDATPKQACSESVEKYKGYFEPHLLSNNISKRSDDKDRGQAVKVESLPYHNGMFYHGIERGAHTRYSGGYSDLTLRIRTSDESIDFGLIGELQKRGVEVEVYDSKAGCGNITVNLTGRGNERYYEITTSGVSNYMVDKVKRKIDRVGKVFLQAKELVQKRGDDSESLGAELYSGPPNQWFAFYTCEGSKSINGEVRKLADRYIAQPGLLDKPLISLFEVGDLADCALGTGPFMDNIRENVRTQVWWQFQSRGGHLTIMEFAKIFHRICDAMGIERKEPY